MDGSEICLSSSSHFPLMPYSRTREALDKSSADRIGDGHEHNRYDAVTCSNGSTVLLPGAMMTPAASATNSTAYL